MYKYRVEYTAWGFARYDGEFEFNSNYDDIEEVKQQAKRHIANKGCFSLNSVKINNIERIN